MEALDKVPEGGAPEESVAAVDDATTVELVTSPDDNVSVLIYEVLLFEEDDNSDSVPEGEKEVEDGGIRVADVAPEDEPISVEEDSTTLEERVDGISVADMVTFEEPLDK